MNPRNFRTLHETKCRNTRVTKIGKSVTARHDDDVKINARQWPWRWQAPCWSAVPKKYTWHPETCSSCKPPEQLRPACQHDEPATNMFSLHTSSCDRLTMRFFSSTVRWSGSFTSIHLGRPLAVRSSPAINTLNILKKT